jgi:hypothetical protein
MEARQTRRALADRPDHLPAESAGASGRAGVAWAAALARDLLHHRDGTLADERDGRTPWHATQRAAWEALKKTNPAGVDGISPIWQEAE